MILLAIDPGNTQSAWVDLDMTRGAEGLYRPWRKGLWANEKMLLELRSHLCLGPDATLHLAIEMVENYGMTVGREVFETCVWIGRFIERFGPHSHTLVTRREVKLHLCGSSRAKDANVRQALIDRWGGKDKAIGYKNCPRCKGKGYTASGRGTARVLSRRTCEDCQGTGDGRGPLYGVTADIWSALAVAVTWAEVHGPRLGLVKGGAV